MALRTFSDANGNPNVFYLNANGAKLKLNANNARPDNRWNGNNRFVFRISLHFSPPTHEASEGSFELSKVSPCYGSFFDTCPIFC